MKIQDIISKLESSDKFKDWKKDNEEFHLAHVFKMFDKENEDLWQVGYYSPKKDRMVTFVMSKDNVEETQETEVFKEPGKSIDPLNVEEVQVDSDAAMESFNKCLQENYPNTQAIKLFFIVQTLPKSGTVFNTTVLSNAFKTINVRIDAKTAEVISHREVTLFEMPSSNNNTKS